MLVRTLEDLVGGRVQPLPQPAAGATHAPRLGSEDGKLDPASMSADEIDRRVRALAGRVGTWMTVKVKGDALLARAIQHEIDHLDGILFTDRLTSLETLRKVEPEEQEKEAELVGA